MASVVTRSSREDIRKRNREIIERANAQFKESEISMDTKDQPVSGLSITRKAETLIPQLWTNFQLHSFVPACNVGFLGEEVEMETSEFTSFKADEVFHDTISEVFLVDEYQLAKSIDFISPEYSRYCGIEMDRSISQYDLPLLSDSLGKANAMKMTTSRTEASNKAGNFSTSHFLRKPQLMTNDLWTGNSNKSTAPGPLLSSTRAEKGNVESEEADDDNDDDNITAEDEEGFMKMIREYDQFNNDLKKKSRKKPLLYNPVTKSKQNAERFLQILPQIKEEDEKDILEEDLYYELLQVKFDDEDLDMERREIEKSKLNVPRSFGTSTPPPPSSPPEEDHKQQPCRQKRKYESSSVLVPDKDASEEVASSVFKFYKKVKVLSMDEDDDDNGSVKKSQFEFSRKSFIWGNEPRGKRKHSTSDSFCVLEIPTKKKIRNEGGEIGKLHFAGTRMIMSRETSVGNGNENGSETKKPSSNIVVVLSSE